MNRIFAVLTVSFLLIEGVSFAQQDPQLTQFMNNRLIYNPGYAGTSEAICANILYRQQWVNFPGAPKTGLLSFDMPLGILPIGIGLNVMSDQIGFDKSLFARLAVSYKKTNFMRTPGTLGVGIDVGILQKSFDAKWITPDGSGVYDGSIPAYTSGTVSIANPNLNKLSYDLGFGVYYSIANKMYVGLSSTHLTAQDLKSSEKIKFSVARHYYLIGGYTFNLNSPVHSITPNIKVKSDASSTQLDVNVTYSYNRVFWVGLTYRLQDAIAPMLGYKFTKGKFNGLKAGYSYDLTLSKIKGYSAGSHEITLGYCFIQKRKVKITTHENGRFL
jgi:type IX secretion system PorP/SprF family membrane protein